jgi:hypothetical protein
MHGKKHNRRNKSRNYQYSLLSRISASIGIRPFKENWNLLLAMHIIINSYQYEMVLFTNPWNDSVNQHELPRVHLSSRVKSK